MSMSMVAEPRIRELNRQNEGDVILEVAPPMVELVPENASLVGVPSSPDRFALGSLRDGRLRVVKPIDVVQMSMGGKFVVEAPELNEFGFGDGFSEAIADLQAAIAELYFTLETEQKRLGPDLAAVWSIISQKVRRADAASCS
jgi:hypothetical protein